MNGYDFHLVSGLLGLSQTPDVSLADENTATHPEAIRAWREIDGWVKAAAVKRTLHEGRMGFLGHTYPGMLDMYSDFTMMTAQTGMHVEILEMCDLEKLMASVTPAQVASRGIAYGNQHFGSFLLRREAGFGGCTVPVTTSSMS